MSSTESAHSTPLLEVNHISKQFPGVKALHRVSLTLNQGELLAVIGENGAGKSTLMKILAGVQEPDTGKLSLEGKPISLSTVDDALDLGIALIDQEMNLCKNLDIGANSFLGREPGRWGMIDHRQTCSESEKLLKRVGLNHSARPTVRYRSVGLH